MKIFKKNIHEEKDLNVEEYGNIFTGLAVLFVFTFIIMAVILMNFVVDSNQINSDNLASHEFNYVVQDYNKNIGIFGKNTIRDLANEVIKNKISSHNSADEIKNNLQTILNDKANDYYKNTGVNFKSEVLSVYNGEDPFHLNVKTLVTATKGKSEYNHVVETKISIEELKDPLPFLMCKEHPTLFENGTKIYYNDAISYYLSSKNLLNPEVYENATSPLFIRKCPFDPYEHHGNKYGMKNCIDNGYFHESADGGCYLCRLEGKATCFHYGLETFIVPQAVSSLNQSSISGSDHVIFYDNYPGDTIVFYEENGFYEILILDSSHGAKYGMN
ncbi:MAG: hypothetical protein FWE58_01225 [Methanobrevibacter sp.]|nr:hypothetical protein [Methanobrevibacter sp.]